MGKTQKNAAAANTTATETATEQPKELSKRQQFRLQPVLLIQTENPKREGSLSFDRYKNYSKLDYSGDNLPTVQNCLDAGVRMDDIKHDSGKGYIAVGQAAIDEYRTRAEREREQAVADAKALLQAEGMKISE